MAPSSESWRIASIGVFDVEEEETACGVSAKDISTISLNQEGIVAHLVSQHVIVLAPVFQVHFPLHDGRLNDLQGLVRRGTTRNSASLI